MIEVPSTNLSAYLTPLTRSNYLAGLVFDAFIREYKVDGLTFEIPRDITTRSFRSRFLFKNYEREEQQLIAAHLPRTARVLELGGCIGVVSCIANKRLNDPSKHVVVEANPKLLEPLARNKSKNGRAFTIKHGIIADGETSRLYLHDLIVGGSTIRQTGRSVMVPNLRIGDLEAENGFTFDTLIMDIECGELPFLESHREFTARLQTVFIEIHDHIFGRDKGDRCRSLLAEAGLVRTARENISEVWRRL